MSSICWPGYETKNSIATDFRRKAYLWAFFLLLWSINITIVLVGLPFLLIGKLVSAKPRSAPQSGRPLTSN